MGDKLREIFATGDISIRWHDADERPDPLSVRVRARRPPPRRAAGRHQRVGCGERLLHDAQTCRALSTRAELDDDGSSGRCRAPITVGPRHSAYRSSAASACSARSSSSNDHVREHAYGDAGRPPAEHRRCQRWASRCENAQLFDETKEALLERQTATAEILRVISGSPTDVQPCSLRSGPSAIARCGRLQRRTDTGARRSASAGRHWSDSRNCWPALKRSISCRFVPLRSRAAHSSR